jgi:short-subunit dehydrogenase
MDQRLKEIKDKFPKIESKSVLVDFSKLTALAEYRSIVESSLQDIDISILALNAGHATAGSYEQISDLGLENVIRVNALHPVYLGKVLVEKMVKRSKRSAIILSSSSAALFHIPNNASYSAAKALVSNFFSAVHYEVKDKIDVLVW